MNFRLKQKELKKIMDERLAPLVDRDYRLLEIPDYPNVGDILIFKGEQDFLRKLPFKCLEMSSMNSFAYRKPRIPEDELLILSGGGYFGNLWTRGFEFQRKVLEVYPNNPILIFPQSVCFADDEAVNDAVRRYGAHPNLRICLRDRQSYDFVRSKFANKCYLIPDMAFYADLQKSSGVTHSGDLLLMRDDKEFRYSNTLEELRNRTSITVADWPTMEYRGLFFEQVLQFLKIRPRLYSILDRFVRYLYCPWQIRRGIKFMLPYDKVYSTRLHGCVMALLLGKKAMAFDNSYGKISSLYHTWLEDCEDIELCR